MLNEFFDVNIVASINIFYLCSFFHSLQMLVIQNWHVYIQMSTFLFRFWQKFATMDQGLLFFKWKQNFVKVVKVRLYCNFQSIICNFFPVKRCLRLIFLCVLYMDKILPKGFLQRFLTSEYSNKGYILLQLGLTKGHSTFPPPRSHFRLRTPKMLIYR